MADSKFSYSRVTDIDGVITYTLSGLLTLDAVKQIYATIEKDLSGSVSTIRIDASTLDLDSDPAAIDAWHRSIRELYSKYQRIVFIYEAREKQLEQVREDNPDLMFSLDIVDPFTVDLSREPNGERAHGRPESSARSSDQTEDKVRKPVLKSTSDPEKKESPVARSLGNAFDRFCSVRYYRKMYPFRHYPVVVIFSKKRLKENSFRRIENLVNVTQFSIDETNPYVQVKIVIPGCIVTPAELWPDLSSKKALARFWVTPITTSIGELKHGYVELRYQGKLLDIIEIPAAVVRQRTALVTMLFGLLMPVASMILKLYESEIKGIVPIVARKVVDVVTSVLTNPVMASLIVAFMLGISATVYIRNLPREAKPLYSSLSV